MKIYNDNIQQANVWLKLFFDIDGTLVSFETHKIPASTQEALKALRDKGIKIFIATGRPQCLINNLSDLEFDGYITVNGSYCFTAGHQPIYKGCIPQEDIERLITFQQKYPVPFVLYTAMKCSSLK